MTAATQWLERTLDDSANKRIAVPEAFLAATRSRSSSTTSSPASWSTPRIARDTSRRELPFLATENLLMEAVRRGGDRQELHERLRVHARASADARAARARPPISSAGSPATPRSACLAPTSRRSRLRQKLIGRSAEQVEIFVREELDPALAGAEAAASAPLRV